MMGVFAGIYLNELVTKRKQINHLKQAMTKIQDELALNKSNLLRTYDTLSYAYEPLRIYFDHVNEDDELLMDRREMQRFQQEYPGIFQPQDSSRVSGEIYRYQGEMGFQIPAVLSVQLSDVAWKAFKDSGLSAISDFECLYNLETVYKLQGKMISEFDAFLDKIGQAKGPDSWPPILSHWKLNLDYQQAYLTSLTPLARPFEDCK